jgi:RNA polymerase sigma factor (sigma-70 family)
MPTRFGGSTVARSEVPSPDCDDDDDTDGDVIRNTQAALRHAIAGVAPDSIVDSAFHVFYDAYTPTIRRYASRFGVRPQDLDDCVQNVLVRVIKKLPPFQRTGPGSFRRWLFLLVHSETRDHSRHCSRHPTRSLSEIEGTEREPVDPRLDPTVASEQAFEVELVQVCLSQLRGEVSKTNFDVVRLRWIVGMRPREIAARLGLSEQAVRNRLHRMLGILRAKINLLSGHEFVSYDRDRSNY